MYLQLYFLIITPGHYYFMEESHYSLLKNDINIPVTQSHFDNHHTIRHARPSTNLSNEYDYALQRLYKKFNKTLPELQRKPSFKKNAKPLLCSVIFSPQSKFIIGWQILNILLIYMYFIQIPIILVFERQQFLDVNERIFLILNIPTISIFALSILINFNTSFYQDGILIEEPQQIRRHYFKTTFFMDLLSILAILLYQILQATGYGEDGNLRLLVAVFFFKIFELKRIQSTMNRSFDLNRKTKALLKLLLLLIKILLICNIVACSAFFISYRLASTEPPDQPCVDCYWVASVKFNNISLYSYTQSHKLGIPYVYSLYWASTTMISIGYGDITPKNPTEVSFTIFVQFLSCLLYGYAINQIWNIIQQHNSKKNKIHTRLNTINLYLRDKGIDQELTSKVNAYLNNYYYSKNLRDRQLENQIISQLTPALRKQIHYQNYSIIFNHIYFNDTDSQLKYNICSLIKQVGYYQEEKIFIDANKEPCLYCVKRGQLLYSTSQSHGYLKILYRSDLFGIYQFFTQLNFMSELKTSQYTLLISLKAADWRSVLKNYQKDFELYYKAKEQILIYHNGYIIKYKCEFCGSSNHRTQSCLDWDMRNDLLEISNLTRYQQNPRLKYVRRRFNLEIQQRHSKHKKGHSVYQRQRHSELHHDSGINKSTLNDNNHKKRKYSIDQHQAKEKPKRIYIKNNKSKAQNFRIIQKLRRQYHLYQQEDASHSSIQSYQQFQQLSIDRVTIYKQYYPDFNFKDFKNKGTEQRDTYRQTLRRQTRPYF